MASKMSGLASKTGAKPDPAPVLFHSIDESKLALEKPKPKQPRPAGIEDNDLKIKKLNAVAAIEARISKRSVVLAMKMIIDIEKTHLQRKIAFGKLAKIFNGKIKKLQQFFMEEMFLAGADREIDLDELLKSSQRNSIVSNESRLSLIFKNRASHAFNRNSSLGSALLAQQQRSSRPKLDRHLNDRVASSLWANDYEDHPWHSSSDQLGGSSVISEEIRLSHTLQNVEMKKEAKPATIKSGLPAQQLSRLEQIFAKKSRKSQDKINSFIQVDKGTSLLSGLLLKRHARALIETFDLLLLHLQAAREQPARGRPEKQLPSEQMLQRLVDASKRVFARNSLASTQSSFYCLRQMKLQREAVDRLIGEAGIEDGLEVRQRFLDSIAEDSEEKAETLLAFLQEHTPNKFFVRLFVLDHLVSNVLERDGESLKFAALDRICEVSSRSKALDRLLLTVDSFAALRRQAAFQLLKSSWARLSRQAVAFSVLTGRADQLAVEALQYSFNQLLTRAAIKDRLSSGFAAMHVLIANKILAHSHDFIQGLHLSQVDSPLASEEDDRSGLPNRDDNCEASGNDPVYITDQFVDDEAADEEYRDSQELDEGVRCFLERLWRVSYLSKRAALISSLKIVGLTLKLDVQDCTVASLYKHVDQQNEEILKTKLYSIEKLLTPLLSRQKYAVFFQIRADPPTHQRSHQQTTENLERLTKAISSMMVAREVREGFKEIQSHAQSAEFQILKGEAMPSIYDKPSTPSASQFARAKSAASISREPPRPELKPIEIDQASTVKVTRLNRSRLVGTPSEISENSFKHRANNSRPFPGQCVQSEKQGLSKPASQKGAFDLDPFELNSLVKNMVLEKRSVFKRKTREQARLDQLPTPAAKQQNEIEEYLRKTAKFGSTPREHQFLSKKPSLDSSKQPADPQQASRPALSKSGSLSLYQQNQKTEKKPTSSVFDDKDEQTPNKHSAITQWKLDKGYFKFGQQSQSFGEHLLSFTYEEKCGPQVRLAKPQQSRYFEVDASSDWQNRASKSSFLETPLVHKQKKEACFGLAGAFEADSSRRNKTEHFEGKSDRNREKLLAVSSHGGWSSSRTPRQPADCLAPANTKHS